MKKLIEALEIFAKYQNRNFPTACDHDVLYIVGITFEEISETDRYLLEDLDFSWSDEDNCWLSYKYGSA